MAIAASNDISHREFKLLLRADRFPTKRSVVDFNNYLIKSVRAIANKVDVHYEEFEAMDSQVRAVQFFDTEDQVFRKNRLILRLRQDNSSGWPDEMCEVTFKRRSPDYDEAVEFEVGCSGGFKEHRKFKEEILRDTKPGSIRRIFSNNNVLQSPVEHFSVPMKTVVELFTGLAKLDLDRDQNVAPVHSVKIYETQVSLGVLTFAGRITSTATLAVWRWPHSEGLDPIVAEFGFAYRKMPEEPKKVRAAHEVADEFFKAIQIPLQDWIFDGTTKTALIYGAAE